MLLWLHRLLLLHQVVAHIDTIDKESVDLDNIISHITQILKLIEVTLMLMFQFYPQPQLLHILLVLPQGDLVASPQYLTGHC